MLSFLRQARQLVLSSHGSMAAAAAGHQSPIYVIGNQSADLDSIISAIVYSYFFSKVALRTDGTIVKTRPHVPLINLPDVASGQALRRLRPEFATALWLSTSSACSPIKPEDEASVARLLAEHVVTVADVKEQVRGLGDQHTCPATWDAVLVDWNALPIQAPGRVRGHGSVEGLEDRAIFNVVGCIDHHEEESFVSANHEEIVDGAHGSPPPRVVEVGPGSCASLVIREIRQRGLWNASSEADAQIAKLALAAILIDTGNLTAPGKVTAVDREAVSFLEYIITGGTSASSWNRESFFEVIQHAKHNSLDFLTIDEILARDYKDWTVSSGRKIGICSVVRSLSWLCVKSESERSSGDASSPAAVNLESFLECLRSFALSRGLNVVAVMTAFTAAETGAFSRELLVWALDKETISSVERFVQQAVQQLQVEPWSDAHLPSRLWIWKQLDVTKSRKQVAPLLRDACT
ncbi:hypothetical protein VTN31DRAFT_5050 [Thermomyces dupontii]|uniref:uncharacterized protein n=1 Tax=Talaromyces thermophilus TaxID=28565 RepID=UPI003744327C